MFNNNKNIFGNNQTPNNIGFQQGNNFGNNSQQQQGNMFNNPQGSMLQQQGNMFSNQQGSMPNNQQQQQSNIFSNQQAGIFANNQNQNRSNFLGGNQPAGNSNIFGVNQQQQQSNNIFGGNQQQGTNIFSGNQQQGANIFSGNQQQGTNIFGGGNQQQGNIFGGNQQETNNIFGGNQQQGGNIFGNPQQQLYGNKQQQNLSNFAPPYQPLNTSQVPMSQLNWPFESDSDRMKLQIKQWSRRLEVKNLDAVKIDSSNTYYFTPIRDLPQNIQNAVVILMSNMKQLKKYMQEIKRENDQLNNKAAEYCQNVQLKLVMYKQILVQNIQQTNLIDEVKQEISMIENQVYNVLVPLYNAYRTGKHFSFEYPDEFQATVTKQVLQRMIQLESKVDEIMACQQGREDQYFSEEQSNNILVIEQLIIYYENVAAKVFEFVNRYNEIKKVQIEKHCRTSSYEDVMRKINQKVQDKMKKSFKCYDLMKEIQDIIQKREEREQGYISKRGQ